MRESSATGSTMVRVTMIVVLVILLPLAYSVVSTLFAREREALLERPDAKYTQCVRETQYMRFHHWEMLRDIREEVVRYGKRGDVGLNQCKQCHTSRANFCDRCHHSVSLKPDCFDCHYYP